MTVAGDAVRSVAELWSAAVKAHGQRVAYRYRAGAGGPWMDMTYREADLVAHEIAAGLAALGVEPGAAVAVLAETRLEWVLADVAILMAGGVTVPIYPSSTSERCAFILRDSGARLVIAENQAQLRKVLAVGPEAGGLRLVRITDEAPVAGGAASSKEGAGVPGSAAVLSWDELRATGRAWQASHAAELERRAAALDREAVFTIVYTSGTAGEPKGAVLTHGNLIAECASARRALAIDERDVQFLFLPLAHVLGRMLVWSAAAAGAVTSIASSSAALKDDLLAVRPTFMIGVPLIYERLHAAIRAAIGKASPGRARLANWAQAVGDEHASVRRAGRLPGLALRARFALAERLVLAKLRRRLGLDRCRFLGSGGAALPVVVAEFFHGIGLLILEGYGLTETMGGAFLNRAAAVRFGSVGRALDVVEAKIEADGEVLLRGPTVFRRYQNQPAATAAALDGEGWLHTGDIGAIKDGFLYITDRKKDLIVTAAGEKVAPQPLENALRARCPELSHVMVHGDGRPHCVALLTLSDGAVARFGQGERARAARSPAARAAVQAAIDALNGAVSRPEQLRAFAILPDELTEAAGELTPSLKIKRRVVEARYAAELANLYPS